MAEGFIIGGLAMDAVGIFLYFWFAPERHPDPQWSAFFAVEGEAAVRREEWTKTKPRREKLSLISMGLIFLGFVGEVLHVV